MPKPVAHIDCADVDDYTTEWWGELSHDAHQRETLRVGSCLYTADALRDVLEQAAQKVVDEYGPTYDVVADKIRAMKDQVK